MKKKIKHLSLILFIITIHLFAISCGDKPEIVEPPLPPPVALPPPSVTSLSPENGTGGTEVTIVGENFGSSMGKLKVAFGSRNAEVFFFSKQIIKVRVPSGERNIAVDVTVSVGDLVSNKKGFFYNKIPPSITSMTATCFYNSTVVITGDNFSTTKEDNIVKFGTTAATVTNATSTSLHVIAPDLGDAITAEVTVTGMDGISNVKPIAVDPDQTKVAKYDWITYTVKPGVTYKTGQFNLFGAVQRRIYVLDVTLDASNTLGIGFSTANAATTTMCKNYNAVAGINAGYFPMDGSTDKDPYIRINGAVAQKGHAVVSAIFSNSALIIHNNVAKVRKFTETHTNLNSVAAAIPVAQAENIIVCGPILITSNEIESQNMSNSHNTSKTARTGLGVTADGKRVFMVVVDTDKKGSVTGVSTPELAKILQALGAVDAMNFDGGGSSTMFIKDQGDNGRVNFPYGDPTQRAVRSVIYVK